jgi:hypothetical protein
MLCFPAVPEGSSCLLFRAEQRAALQDLLLDLPKPALSRVSGAMLSAGLAPVYAEWFGRGPAVGFIPFQSRT